MSVRNFVPELWRAPVDVALRSRLVYAGPLVVNREYEGDIQAQGDTVRVTSVGRPTISDYVPGPGGTVIAPEPINTGQRVFQVDQAKYWALAVDDVDKAQVNDNLMPVAMDEAGYATVKVIDSYVAGLYTQIPTSVPGLTIDDSAPSGGWVTEAAKAYDEILVPLGVKLDEMDVPEEGRYCIMPPWLYGVLRRDSRFIEAQKSADPSALRTGHVGDASGFTILKSNNVPVPTTSNFVITAGTNRAITFADQITEMEAYRPESGFADAVKSLRVYGAKVFRTDSIVKTTIVRG